MIVLARQTWKSFITTLTYIYNLFSRYSHNANYKHIDLLDKDIVFFLLESFNLFLFRLL